MLLQSRTSAAQMPRSPVFSHLLKSEHACCCRRRAQLTSVWARAHFLCCSHCVAHIKYDIVRGKPAAEVLG